MSAVLWEIGKICDLKTHSPRRDQLLQRVIGHSHFVLCADSWIAASARRLPLFRVQQARRCSVRFALLKIITSKSHRIGDVCETENANACRAGEAVERRRLHFDRENPFATRRKGIRPHPHQVRISFGKLRGRGEVIACSLFLSQASSKPSEHQRRFERSTAILPS
jgi:hypothetical protein